MNEDHEPLPLACPERPTSLNPAAIAGGLVLVLLLGGGLVVVGAVPRLAAQKQRDENRRELANPEPQVAVVLPRAENSERIINLPGSLEASQEIKVNARIDGYISKWYVDIGDPVRKGQILASIEAPELDQRRAEAVAAVREAEADVAQAEADVRRVSSERARLQAEEEQARAEVGQNRAEIRARKSDAEFARVSNDRWQALVADQAISLQEADQRASNYQAAKANVESGQERLLAAASRVRAVQARKVALQAEIETGHARVRSAQAKVEARQTAVRRTDIELSFCSVTAPFAGIITQRLVDTGSLVSAGGDKTTLFHLSQSTRLRIFVDVPQGDAPLIRTGLPAQVKIKEYPQKIFSGTVTRTAGALDEGSRTLRTQIEMNNPGHLESGMHADVCLHVHGTSGAVVIPSTAVLVRADGAKVITLDAQQHIHSRSVRLGLDFGKEMEILSGLDLKDRLVNFPADGLVDGSTVRVLQPSSTGEKSQ